MPVFFLPPAAITPPSITVPPSLQTHLRDSLRLEIGEQIWVCDEQGSRYLMELTRVTKQELTGRILSTSQEPARTAPRLRLAQALLKGEKMDWVIQKATELGVSEIVPLQSRHTIVQLRPERLDAQLARWQRIALEAAQQSEQWHRPVIAQPHTLTAWLATHPAPTLSLILTERQNGQSLRTLTLPTGNTESVSILIGPEGGWSKEETAQAEQAGATFITLGPQILRAETAAIVAVGILQSHLGALE
ncbi:MAG: Ribosomal RNA small subunit methyltransferase E [Nitrospira sp.]|nr:MAG: Ribosomal RNA small subunit methyltransferase E [Nitrospira sp.]